MLLLLAGTATAGAAGGSVTPKSCTIVPVPRSTPSTRFVFCEVNTSPSAGEAKDPFSTSMRAVTEVFRIPSVVEWRNSAPSDEPGITEFNIVEPQ